MSKSVVKINGLKELKSALKENKSLSEVKDVVKKHTAKLNSAMVRNTGEKTFYKGYFTGNLKQHVGFTMSDGGLTGTVGTTVDYAPYLEYGTRFMDKEPFAEPSLKEVEPDFVADMEKLVK